MSNEVAQQKLDLLVELLADFDTEAIELVEELIRGKFPQSAELKEINTLCQQYNFSQAIELFKQTTFDLT
jgi:hypothetical protein